MSNMNLKELGKSKHLESSWNEPLLATFSGYQNKSSLLRTVRHFSVFSHFPSEKKTQLKNSRVPKNTWSENRVSQKPLVDHYSLS